MIVQVDNSGNTLLLPNYWSALIITQGLMVQLDGKIPNLVNNAHLEKDVKVILEDRLQAAVVRHNARETSQAHAHGLSPP